MIDSGCRLAQRGLKDIAGYFHPFLLRRKYLWSWTMSFERHRVGIILNYIKGLMVGCKNGINSGC